MTDSPNSSSESDEKLIKTDEDISLEMTVLSDIIIDTFLQKRKKETTNRSLDSPD